MIPDTLHFIWIQKEKSFGLLEYLSIKSAIKNTNYTIFLHTNLQESLLTLYNPFTLVSERFHIIYRDIDLCIDGLTLTPVLFSDLLRIKILQEYGGIYSDLDMLWFAPIPIDLTSINLLGVWQCQKYKNVATYVIASEKGYDFSNIIDTHKSILQAYRDKGKTEIKPKSLKEYVILHRVNANFFRDHADVLLKQKYFEKNTWKNIWRFLTDQIPQEKIVLKDICGLHICGCNLFGQYKCNTSDLLTKHTDLKLFCDRLLVEN